MSATTFESDVVGTLTSAVQNKSPGSTTQDLISGDSPNANLFVSDYNFSCVSVNGNATLITPDAVLEAHHYPQYSVSFIGTDGGLYGRNVVQLAWLNNDPNLDIEIGLLNAPLPPVVTPAQVLPSNYASYFPTSGELAPVVRTSQYRTLSITDWEYSSGGTSWFQPATEAALAPWATDPGSNSEYAVSGDSGSGVFTLVDGATVCVGALHYTSGFSDLSDNTAGVNAILAGWNAGQLSPVDLSGFAKSTSLSLENNSGSTISNATQSLSFTSTITAGVPDGETISLEDASNSDAVVATAITSDDSVNFTVPAGTLLAGSHRLFSVYTGDSNYAPGQSSTFIQTVQVVVTSVVVNGNNSFLAGAQRSMVNSILYSYSEAVNIGAGGFNIGVNAGFTGTVPTLNWVAIGPSADGSSRQWEVTFSGNGVSGGSIANGVYDITMNAAAVTSDANAMVSAQARATDTFWRLFGDYVGDGNVDTDDDNAFNSTYGLKSTQSGYIAAFDASGTEARINGVDYNDFIADYGVQYQNVASVATI